MTQTKLYRKPTDKNLLLHFTSHHPFHLKRNIVYTQALRYKRIISDPQGLKEELRFLWKVFRARGYPNRLIKQQFNKASLIPRQSLLKDKPTSASSAKFGPRGKRMMKLPFHPDVQPHHRRLHHIWDTMVKDRPLDNIWPNPPCIIQETAENLKDILVNARQKKDCVHQQIMFSFELIPWFTFP